MIFPSIRWSSKRVRSLQLKRPKSKCRAPCPTKHSEPAPLLSLWGWMVPCGHTERREDRCCSSDALEKLPELRVGAALRLLEKSSQNAYHMPGVRMENYNRACDSSRTWRALTSASLRGGTQSGQKFADPAWLQWLTQGSLVPVVDSKLTVFSFLILLSLLLSIKKKNHTHTHRQPIQQGWVSLFSLDTLHSDPQASQWSLLAAREGILQQFSSLHANLVLSRHF